MKASKQSFFEKRPKNFSSLSATSRKTSRQRSQTSFAFFLNKKAFLPLALPAYIIASK